MERRSMMASGGLRVDTHAHIYHDAMPLAQDAWHRPVGEAPLDAYLACLDAHGIDRAVLAAVSLFGDYNDYALEAVAAQPRLRTTVIIDPETDIFILREMAKAGVVGVRLQWRSTPHPPDLDSFAWRKLFRRVADLGWHIQLHDNGPRLPDAIAAIERSGAPIVIDHFGRPDAARGVNCPGFVAVLRAVERGNCWVKMSGAFRLGPPAMVRELAAALLRQAGPERLLWGSDWPFAAFEGQVAYADTLACFEQLVPDAALRARIHRTAARFYFGEE
ncbi:amidohydrolase family protein [Sphingobium lignivorans]|uniref:TIM-barrel fold metal-dependent hydrolase n=1 Tax=Sphingobium lignivorans TaxID=2735886 RepID=A0ABR6NJR2_9SPHN|nr:amidohydrolase family protein [Sphingobium lignivorans]MBB5987526.1 putative TIM-barrel fold metal-dependent hydrolase [Sphingobium lignivorans]